MPYRFATHKRDYADYAGGRVFYAAPGHPAFPVRLISEVLQRCLAVRQAAGLTAPAVVYDPCCGSAYHLSTLAYLHWEAIDTIIGSDIDADILDTAARNLSLLTPAGLERRADEIREMLDQYGKASHAAALDSVQRLRDQLHAHLSTRPIHTDLFPADATDPDAVARGLQGRPIDIVLADIPYGYKSSWQTEGEAAGESLLPPMLDALLAVIGDATVVAIMADKVQKAAHPRYRRVDQFQIGKRRMTLLQRATP